MDYRTSRPSCKDKIDNTYCSANPLAYKPSQLNRKKAEEHQILPPSLHYARNHSRVVTDNGISRPAISDFCCKEQHAAEMEIITFDHKVYQDLSEKIERIADYVFKKEAQPQHTPEIWLTSEELADLLKISTRTLQRLRKERVIPYTMVRSKCLYRLSDVEECISRRIVACTPQTLDEFRKSYYLTHKSPAL